MTGWRGVTGKEWHHSSRVFLVSGHAQQGLSPSALVFGVLISALLPNEGGRRKREAGAPPLFGKRGQVRESTECGQGNKQAGASGVFVTASTAVGASLPI